MASDAPSSSGPGAISEQAVIGKWQALRQEVGAAYSRIAELETELAEHKLVISTIEKMEPSRRCFRMVGGVLVERTVGEVLPAVRRNREGLEGVIAKLADVLAAKKSELQGLEQKYNIRIRNVDDVVAQQQASGDSDKAGNKGGTGVLVQPSA